MKKLIMIAIALLLSSCASMQDNRPIDRIIKVCAYNTFVNWMSSGSNATAVQGDAAKALDAVTKYRIFEGVCYENEDTIKENL